MTYKPSCSSVPSRLVDMPLASVQPVLRRTYEINTISRGMLGRDYQRSCEPSGSVTRLMLTLWPMHHLSTQSSRSMTASPVATAHLGRSIFLLCDVTSRSPQPMAAQATLPIADGIAISTIYSSMFTYRHGQRGRTGSTGLWSGTDISLGR